MASQKPRRAKQPGKPAPASKQPPTSSGSKTGWPAWALPNLTVFVSSLCIMVVELVAGRLIARYVGSSLYTWTSVIGIVLAGIAGGNYVGGRLADRYPPRRTLSLLFLLSASLCVLTPVLNDLAGGSSFLRGQEWSVRVTAHALCVFFLPSFMMGAISPVAAKMALDNGRETGRTVGSVYSPYRATVRLRADLCRGHRGRSQPDASTAPAPGPFFGRGWVRFSALGVGALAGQLRGSLGDRPGGD